MIKRLSLTFIAFSVPFIQLWMALSVSAASPHVVISEVVADGGGGASQEYVELYNNSSSDVSLVGWTIQLRSGGGSVSRNISLGRALRAQSYALVASTGYPTPCANSDFTCFSAGMTAAGGHVILLDNTGAIIDKLGWGSAVDPETTAVGIPLFGVGSLTRKTANVKVLQDTDNNLQDFESGAHTPIGGGLYDPAPVDICPNLAGEQETMPHGYHLILGSCELIPDPDPDPTPTPHCLGISISEIVPNPAGDDTGKEYIELYNETNAAVDLTGCILKVGSSQQVLSGMIEPGYKAFYGLTLPNTAGGQVSFVTNTYTLNVTYPPNMGDDESYGYLDGVWQAGLTASPNSVSLPVTDIDESQSESDTTLVDCGPGKYRNPETNRCRNIEAEAGLAPCSPGQVRNPETNRCRNITTTGTTLAACKADETRNPDTNRCRKNSSVTTTKTTCQPGQERNPETNRCRKVAAAKTTNPLGTTADASKKPISYLVLGIVAALAVAYGIFEYRTQIRDLILRRRQKD